MECRTRKLTATRYRLPASGYCGLVFLPVAGSLRLVAASLFNRQHCCLLNSDASRHPRVDRAVKRERSRRVERSDCSTG